MGRDVSYKKKRVQEFISHVAGNKNWNDRKNMYGGICLFKDIRQRHHIQTLHKGPFKSKKINSDMDPEILFELLELIEPFELFQPFRAFKPFGPTLGKWHNCPVQIACRQYVFFYKQVHSQVESAVA